jgi:ribosomal protein S18 acetylase RimI-like enzyme
MFVIRPLRLDDLDAAVELFMTTSVLDIRNRLVERLATPKPDQVSYALVAVRDGVVVGAAQLTTEPYFPGTAAVLVAVDVAARGQGLGTRLAAMLVDRFTRTPEVRTATCAIRDDLGRGRKFAEKYGFAVTNHSVGLRLDLSGPDDELAGRAKSTAEAAGVVTRTADVDTERVTVIDCVRRSMIGLPVPFGEDQVFDPELDSQLLPAGSMIVLAESLDRPGHACAVTILAPETGGGSWHIGYTGVDPDYRGRGVAAAVKTASLRHAYRAGVRSVTTVNDESNRAILHLNQKLGMTAGAGYWALAHKRTA